MCIELIRQFYDLPRQFRITGQLGIEQFVSYSNSGIKPQYQGMIGDTDLGMRLPVFDIKVILQKKNSYTRLSQNELALQFYQLGFFAERQQKAFQTLMSLISSTGYEANEDDLKQSGMSQAQADAIRKNGLLDTGGTSSGAWYGGYASKEQTKLDANEKKSSSGKNRRT